MNIKTKALAVLCALLSIQAQAVIYHTDVWHNENTGQTVYACSDVHVDFPGSIITTQQQNDLIAGAKKLGATCLVEDRGYDKQRKNTAMKELNKKFNFDERIRQTEKNAASKSKVLNYTGSIIGLCYIAKTMLQSQVNRGTQGSALKLGLKTAGALACLTNIYTTYNKMCVDSPIRGLGVRCKDNNIPCSNIDNRHIILSAEANATWKAHSDLLANLKRIRLSANKEALNSFYNSFFERYSDIIKRQDTRAAQEILPGVVDLNILNAIGTTNAKTIFVIAGGLHIAEISQLLPHLDYKKTETYGKQYDFKKDSPLYLQVISLGIDRLRPFYANSPINLKRVFGLPEEEPAHTHVD